jgi:hypothetical protein
LDVQGHDHFLQGRPMRELYEDDIRDGLRAHRGNVSMVAHLLCVERGELFEFVRTRPKLFRIIVDFREQLVDNSEMYLHEAVDMKRPWAITFTQKTLGKHRQNGQNTPNTKQLEQLQGNLGKITIEQLTQVDEMMNRPCAGPAQSNLPEPEYVALLDQAGERVLSSLVKFIGRMGLAAKELGVKKGQLADYLKRRPQLEAALQDRYEYLSDHAEYTLHELIDAQEPWAIKYVLKTLGRSRGYSDIPLNDLVTLSGGLAITRLSMGDLSKLERLRGMVEPVPDKIGDCPVVAGAKPTTGNPAIPESNSVGQTAETLRATIKTVSQQEKTTIDESTPAVSPAPVVVAAAAESLPATQAEEPRLECEPAPVSVNDLPIRVDVSSFTPEQRMEFEIMLGRVHSKVKIREIYNPDWPEDHPIYREHDDTAPKEPPRSDGSRAPPDTT